MPMNRVPGIRLTFIFLLLANSRPAGSTTNPCTRYAPPPHHGAIWGILQPTPTYNAPEVRMRRLPILFAILCLQPPTAHAVTVDEIVARNLEAHGGLARLRALRSLRLTGKIAFGADASFELAWG